MNNSTSKIIFNVSATLEIINQLTYGLNLIHLKR